MAQVVTLRRFDAAAYALVGSSRAKSPENVREQLLALAKTAKLDNVAAELASRDADTLAAQVPTWVARMRRAVIKGVPKVERTHGRHDNLNGERLVHAAVEPWRAMRYALAYNPKLDPAELFTKRKADLFRTYPVRDPRDFFEATAAQICELQCFATVTKHRPALADIDTRLAHVVRNVGRTVKHMSPTLRDTLETLRERLVSWPELGSLAAAVADVRATKSAKAVPHVSDASAIPEIRHAVVVGAGPAGLAAAVELASRGIAVDLVDARDPWDYTRPVQMVVKQHGVDQMKHLGILDAIRPHLSAITHDFDETPTTWRADPVTGVRDPDAHRLTRSGEIFASSRSVYSATLNVIERALFERALELGVRPISNATIGFGKVRGSGATLRRTVWYQRGQASGPKFTPHGRRHSLGTPDLVLIAEGSRSQRRRDFRVAWDKGELPKKRGLAGLVRVDIGSTTHTWSESETEQKDVVISVGHATSGATWTLAEVPNDRRIKDKNDAARFFLQRASRALNTPLQRSDLLFGGNVLFNIENRSVRRAAYSVSERQAIFAIGDSKGIGSPTIGLGMQYGISVDAAAVARFVDNVPTLGFKQSAAIFNATTRDNLRAWHKRV